jgi:hypothetical protein
MVADDQGRQRQGGLGGPLVEKEWNQPGGLAIWHGLFQQEAFMRKIMLSTVCAAVIGLSAIAAASAQTSNAAQPAGAAANTQTTAAPATTGKSPMDAMNKTKKKKMKKDTKMDSGMEKK